MNLIERLRIGFGGMVPPVCDEAADEIERLTYDLDKCREGSAIRTRINDKQVAEIEHLQWRFECEATEARKKIRSLEAILNKLDEIYPLMGIYIKKQVESDTKHD